MRHQQVLNKLCELFSSLLRMPIEEIDVHAQLVEMGADSLVLVSGVSVIEDHFGVKIEIRQFFEEITSLNAIATYLESRSNIFSNTNLDSATSISATNAQTNAVPHSVEPVASQIFPSPSNQIAFQQTIPNTTQVQFPAIPFASSADPEQMDAIGQLILAQTQLMAQQLAMLSGTQANQPLVLPQTASTIAPTQYSQNSDAPKQPEQEDRSSPLRALNAPINPNASSGLSEQQSKHLAKLIADYQARTPKSKELAQACRPTLADSRASIGFRFSTKEILYPITGVESTGSRLRDIDGNEYVDLTMGFGVLLFGSRPEHMKGVLEAEIHQGFQLGPRSEHMLEISRLFTEMTGHERVAFTNSGTEAIMIALRLARAATGRDKIVIFDRAYNGHSDGTLAKTNRGPHGELISEPIAPGVPANVAKDVIVLEYGDPESLYTIRNHAHELAAVLVEPVQSRRLDLQPVEYLRELRKITQESNVALIFDEMVSGFRAHPAGVQGLWGIKADIATYGKIVGGGTPVGAVAGSAKYLDGIDGGMWQYGDASYPAAKRTYFGGTFCQHPFSMAACLATLRHMKSQGPALQANLNARTAAFAKRLNDFFEDEGLSIRVVYFASTFGFKFSGNIEVFFYHLLLKGIYIWEWRACFLSTAHTDTDLDYVVQAIKETVQEMREGGFLPLAGSNGKNLSYKSNEKKPNSSSSSAVSVKSVMTSLPARTFSKNHASLQFGIYFFGNYDAAFSQDKYDLLMQGSMYADQNGFNAIWLPERHFDKFGGFSPNPAVLAAALARETQRIQLRAGSVVMPLHHPLRVAEEWSVVDNLSNGRAGISFAAGWHPNDFALAPDNFTNNREITFEGIEKVKQLWRGENVHFRAGNNKQIPLGIYPRPNQKNLPAWLTVVANPDTYRKAGEMGLGILTNLLGQSLEELEANIAIYHQALKDHGHSPESASVAILLHTYICEDNATAVEQARKPMSAYLLSSLSLFQKMAESLPPHLRDIDRASDEDKAFIVGKAYERYIETRALIGSPEHCRPIVERMIAMGVTEISCFVDFGIDAHLVMQNLPQITAFKDSFLTRPVDSNSFPLSEAQQQLWLIAKLHADGNRAYNDPGCIVLEGVIDTSLLESAINQVVERHESLRTRIADDGQSQTVAPASHLALHCLDLAHEADPESAAQEWMVNQSSITRDLANDPLFTPTLLKIGSNRHILYVYGHHIISDGPSMGTVIQEICQLYEVAKSGQQAKLPAVVQYRDFVRWHTQNKNSPSMLSHETYWLKQFEQPIPALELPTDFTRPEIKTYTGKRIRKVMPENLSQRLRNCAREQGSTMFMLLFAAYSALLHRVSGQDRIVIGAPYSGRGIDGAQGLVGYGIHLLPVISDIGDKSFGEHLAEIKGTLLNAYTHQDYPFSRLIDKINVQRDPGRSPLVSTIFNLERLPQAQPVADLLVSPYQQPITYTRVELTFTVNLIGDQIVLECDYNTDLFSEERMIRLLDSYECILESVCDDIQTNVLRMPLVSTADSQNQLRNWSAGSPAKSPSCFHTAFEEQAHLHPELPALIEYFDHGETLSYDQLNRRANQLARRLRALGVKPEDRVGICLPRSNHLIIAMLATLKAGAAYVPMDPSYPSARLDFLQRDARVSILISDQDTLKRIGLSDVKTFDLTAENEKTQLESEENLNNVTVPANLAYVIYTSGSTGTPKGAMITHEGFMNYLTWAVDEYEAKSRDGSPVLGSIGFDATITSIFVPLLAGNKVVLLPEGAELEAIQALTQSPYKYSFIKLTPAHLEALNTLRAQNPQGDSELAKYLILGGEALSGASLDPWFDHTQTFGINEYGPTETVVGCCTYTAKEKLTGSVPIGMPIQGTQLYVLDASLNQVPVGVDGELYIGGSGVARGYLARPGQTAAVFVPNPFSSQMGTSGDRLYKTGDRVRYLADGTLIFLGRMDNQIKLNGFRIEPGEIEAAIVDQNHVREAVVMLIKDSNGQSRLVAYLTAEKQKAIDISALKDELRRVLPAHMIPSIFTVIDEMPLTTHGKVNRSALPAPDFSSLGSSHADQAPSSEIEEKIATVWRNTLSLNKVGIHQNFFDIGGNSILLLQAFKQLESILPPGFLVVDLFRFPTIASLAERLAHPPEKSHQESADISSRANLQRAAAMTQANRQRALKTAAKPRRKTT